MSDFRQFVFKYHFPVIAISESRVGPNVRISGYELFHSQRGTGLSRVLLGIRKDLTYVEHTLSPNDTNEYIAVTIRKGGICFTVITGYIPPRATFDAQRLADILWQTPSPHLLTGDFNAHHSLWGSTKNNARGKALFEIMLNYDLVILNDGSPTFFE